MPFHSTYCVHVAQFVVCFSHQELYKAGEKKWGTDESTFNRILCTQSHEQLALTFAEYEKISSKNMKAVIKSEFSGDIQDGMLAVGKERL